MKLPHSVYYSLEEMKKVFATCTDCTLCNHRKNVVMPYGNPHARLFFIGEAPGEVEDEKGYPFIGPAGMEFNKMLKDVGLTRDEIWTTNAVMCHPVDDIGENRKPTKKELLACRDRLWSEILQVDPDLLILMGESAVKSLYPTMKGTKITSLVGSLLPIPVPYENDLTGTYLGLVLYHPAYLMRIDAGWAEAGPFRQTTDDIRFAVHILDYLKLLRENPELALQKDVVLPDRGEDISYRAELGV